MTSDTPEVRTARAQERLLEGLPVADRRPSVPGRATAVMEGGDGPPVVLVHGQGARAAEKASATFGWPVDAIKNAGYVVPVDQPDAAALRAGIGRRRP